MRRRLLGGVAAVTVVVGVVATANLYFPIEHDFDDWESPLAPLESLNAVLSKTQFSRFIGATYVACGGLGNQMFRTASLYSLGQRLGREPFLNATLPCTIAWMQEFRAIFPHMAVRLHLAAPAKSLVRRVQFGDACCTYEDVGKLPEASEPFLVLSGNYLQSVKYFENRTAEIRHLFEFPVEILETVKREAEKLFANDTFHKLCVHVRRGDFLFNEALQESRADFVDAAIGFVRAELRRRGVRRASVVFLGAEVDFLQNLNFSRSPFHAIYRAEMPTRGADMAFGVHHCHSLLISASASTFAFWIGFLMRPGASVFYNAKVTRTGSTKWPHVDYFPSHWISLHQNERTKTVSVGV